MNERAYITFKEATLITFTWWARYILFVLLPIVIFIKVVFKVISTYAEAYKLTYNLGGSLRVTFVGALLCFIILGITFDKRFMYKAIVKNYKKFSINQSKEFFTWWLYIKFQCLRMFMTTLVVLPIWILLACGIMVGEIPTKLFEENLFRLCMMIPSFLVTSQVIESLINKDYGERSFQVLRKLHQEES